MCTCVALSVVFTVVKLTIEENNSCSFLLYCPWHVENVKCDCVALWIVFKNATMGEQDSRMCMHSKSDTVISAHMLFYCDRWVYRWHIWCFFPFSQNPHACMSKIPHDCGHSNGPHLQSNENVGQRLTVSVMAVHRQRADGHLCQHIAQHLGHGARGAYANGVPQGYLITAQLKQPLCHLGRNRGKPWKHYPLWKYKQDEGVHTESSFWALEKHCRVSASCRFFSKHRNKGLVGLWKLWEEKICRELNTQWDLSHTGRPI